MGLIGFLLSVLAIAFVIAKVIFSSKAKTPASTQLPEDKSNDDGWFIDVPTAGGTPLRLPQGIGPPQRPPQSHVTSMY